jgi:hypothetical protein
MQRLLSFSLIAAVLSAVPARAEISYADILADPDNPALNQQFARERLASGQAKAALAAVERVLVAEPTNLGARLFRAEVLAALGADLQAEGELRALAALPLPANIKARVKTMQAQIDRRRKKFTAQANLSFGYTQNDNAANWPSDNTILFQGRPQDSEGVNRYKLPRLDTPENSADLDDYITAPAEDTVSTTVLALSGNYDLGGENWRSLFISAAGNQNGGGDTGYMDGTTSSFATGLVYKSRRFTLVPRLSHAQVENDFEERLGNYAIHGASLVTEYQAGSRNVVTLSFGQTNLRFEGDKSVNDTDTLSGSFGWESQLGKRVSATLGSFYQNVDSRGNRDLDKTLSGVNMSLRLGLARGQFLTLSGSSLETEHDNVYSQSYRRALQNGETEADGDKRADDITSTNVSYLLLGSALSPKLSNVFFTLNHQASETQSSIIGFSQERNIISARVNFTHRF